MSASVKWTELGVWQSFKNDVALGVAGEDQRYAVSGEFVAPNQIRPDQCGARRGLQMMCHRLLGFVDLIGPEVCHETRVHLAVFFGGGHSGISRGYAPLIVKQNPDATRAIPGDASALLQCHGNF